MNHKVLILVPTRPEIEPFLAGNRSRTEVVITGIGPYKCAEATVSAITGSKPDLLILAGIAGAYPGSSLQSGDTVLVGTEHSADLGTFAGNEFRPKFVERYVCPHIPAGVPMRVVQSNSVSCSAAPFVARAEVQIENMEGAAFFYACLRHRVPFLEIRAVSNLVGEDFAQWNIPRATVALADALNRIIRIFAKA